jgi:GNAT superfamily N-acetyltransferase
MHGSSRASGDAASPGNHIGGIGHALRVHRVDWTNPRQTTDWLRLLDSYARDPMGGGRGLSDHARTHLVEHFGAIPHAFALLAYWKDDAVGIANCIESFSTFACAKVVNLHDFAVDPDWRGRGVGQFLMSAVESEARRIGCCKLTLEVLEGNKLALAMYQKAGFCRYQLDASAGGALFLEKNL